MLEQGTEGGVEWPVLRASQDIPCDGVNPLTNLSCRLGYHKGLHRDEVGAHWLDDEENDDPPGLVRKPGPGHSAR